jgi:rhodanese-related sulfurtransferase
MPIAGRENMDGPFERTSSMTRSLSFALAALIALAIPGPAFTAENWPDSVDQYVQQIRKAIKATDMDGYLAAVKAPEGALLLDVREDDEFKAGHVPGAVNMPRGLLAFRIWKLLGYPAKVDLDRRIFVQCATGGRATLATKELQDIGFSNVIAAIVNFRDWTEKGHPVVR